MRVAATNPCPCGFYGDPLRECTCSSTAITRYQKRLSGPLLDRIDIQIGVPRVEASDRLGEPSGAIQERVEAARKIRVERNGGSASNGRFEPG